MRFGGPNHHHLHSRAKSKKMLHPAADFCRLGGLLQNLYSVSVHYC